MSGEPGEKPHSIVRSVAAYATVGLEMGISVALGVAAGMWLDRRLETDWLTLVGLFVGLGAAGRALWRVAARAQAEAQQDEAAVPSPSDAASASLAPKKPEQKQGDPVELTGREPGRTSS